MKIDLSTISLCVVGNSSCENEQRKGKIIDSFDYVARFNNFNLSHSYEADYGTKCHIWVTSFAKDVHLKKSPFKLVCCPFPLNKAEYRIRYPYTNIDALSKYKIEFIPTVFFDELVTYNKNPSTGIAFLFWLYKLRGSLSHDAIFAFSFFDKRFAHHYFEEGGETTHNGILEMKMFHSFLNPSIKTNTS